MIHAGDCQRKDDREQNQKRQPIGSITQLTPGTIDNFNGWEERPGRLKASYANAHELAICALTATLS